MIDYFAENLWQMWALVSIVCLILELTNGDFFIICFAIGAACSVTSVLSLFFVRPAMLKHLHRNEDSRVSNADAIIGRIGRVSETIEKNGYGRVAIDGDDWKALSQDGEAIEKDTNVKVISRDSIIITVARN